MMESYWIQEYPFIVGDAETNLVTTIIAIGGKDTFWEPSDRVLLWVPDFSIALHVAMAVDVFLDDERPLVLIPLQRRGEAAELLSELYPHVPHRWVFEAMVFFPSAKAVQHFDRQYERHVSAFADDPITMEAAECIMRSSEAQS